MQPFRRTTLQTFNGYSQIVIEMNWTDNEILLNHNETTPCKDIFQAVCDELGKYYSDKGFKYARSKPKLTYKDILILD